MSIFGILSRDTGASSLPKPIILQYVMVCIIYVRNKLSSVQLNSLSLNLFFLPKITTEICAKYHLLKNLFSGPNFGNMQVLSRRC